MREFGKTPRPLPWWKRILNSIRIGLFGGTASQRFMGHDDRMKKRRRKTKFDR